MKRKATPSNPGQHNTVAPGQHAPGDYRKVFDARKRRVRGLWERNGTFYAQITIPDPSTGRKAVRRVRLEDKAGNPVTTLASAVKGMSGLKYQRDEDNLKLAPKRTPTFAEYAASYIDRLEKLKDAKRPHTVRREKQSCRTLAKVIGELRLRGITTAVLNDYKITRQADGVSARSINIEIGVLRNVLRAAMEDKHIVMLPEAKRLKETKPKRRLLTMGEIERVAEAAKTAPQTGQQVADFIRLMSYSGGRWGETLRLRWQDVDFTGRQIHFGADGLSKNGEARAVDFNPKLESHLRDMLTRKAPDSTFLFPSRQRGPGKDLHAVTFNKTLRDARTAAGVPDFTCHMCRHFFASMCLMAKTDVHTVASWLGHRDNGVLLARTYSHLLNSHKAAQARNVTFEPVVLPDAINQ